MSAKVFVYNPLALIVVVLFIISLFYPLIQLPADTLFDYPELRLASGHLGAGLVMISTLYGLFLATGFYRWRTRVVGLVAFALLARQVWLLYEAVMTASDAYQFRMGDIGELVGYLTRDPVTQFSETAGMAAAGLITLLFCGTLFMPYRQNSAFK